MHRGSSDRFRRLAEAPGRGQLLPVLPVTGHPTQCLEMAKVVWTDFTKIKVQASEMKAAKFYAIFSQRKAMRLKRLILPTPCSARARPL